MDDLLPVNQRLQKPLSLNDPVKEIENDLEFKAYIYQQLVDLQPFLQPESQISVMVHVDQDEESDTGLMIKLLLVANFGDQQVEAEGVSEDVYEAIRYAKETMLGEFEGYYNAAIDASERESEIRLMLSGERTLH